MNTATRPPRVPLVTILMGVPGSGKSTWTKENRPTARVVSADHFFTDSEGNYNFDPTKMGEAHGMCLREYTETIQRRVSDVVVDNTNTTLLELGPYVSLAAAYGYRVEIIYLDCNHEVAATRNVHGVPLETVKKLAMNIMYTLRSIPPWWPRPQTIKV